MCAGGNTVNQAQCTQNMLEDQRVLEAQHAGGHHRTGGCVLLQAMTPSLAWAQACLDSAWPPFAHQAAWGIAPSALTPSPHLDLLRQHHRPLPHPKHARAQSSHTAAHTCVQAPAPPASASWSQSVPAQEPAFWPDPQQPQQPSLQALAWKLPQKLPLPGRVRCWVCLAWPLAWPQGAAGSLGSPHPSKPPSLSRAPWSGAPEPSARVV